ncbi:CDP-glycerol glycerophosphotransferase family protein [Cloacibacillus sp. An23]|uniref:CDP-glycerol glycerophosphotransferase family protein n=1 Tax=Cloacibacillus sp. An23 TaxID=1965591 RepID=UPI000B396DA8|nr:CDP-glycerol glycerophosphotransferase family protein [Cloacibacillus sp. An23]OUO91580.1 hypothetical protein B5F39_12605 [Cloacibacillus sp. An23]
MKYYIKKIINIILGVLSILVPKTSKIIVIGGWFGQRFADNSKAFYLFLVQNKSRLGLKKVVFTTRNETIFKVLRDNNLDVVYTNSLISIWYHLRAKFHIVDEGGIDLNRFCSSDAIRINLWHGFPLKKIGYYCNNDIKNIRDAIAQNKAKTQYQIGKWNDAFYLAFSDTLAKHMQFAFGCNDEKIIIGPYPRHAYILGYIKKMYLPNEKAAIQSILEAKKQGQYIVMYLPTFRDSITFNDICAKTPLLMKSFLKKNNIYLVTKFHFAASQSNVSYARAKDVIINLPKESDIYNFLDISDMLITDYSSVFFDYILLNKPVLFYCFDYEYYLNKDRGFLYDYVKMTPGRKVKSINELKNSILNIKNAKYDYIINVNSQLEQVKNIVYGTSPIYPNEDNMYKLYECILDVTSTSAKMAINNT